MKEERWLNFAGDGGERASYNSNNIFVQYLLFINLSSSKIKIEKAYRWATGGKESQFQLLYINTKKRFLG